MQKILNFRVSFNFSFFLSAAFLFQHFRQFVSSFVRLLAVSISVYICVFVPRRFTLSRLICMPCKKYFFSTVICMLRPFHCVYIYRCCLVNSIFYIYLSAAWIQFLFCLQFPSLTRRLHFQNLSFFRDNLPYDIELNCISVNLYICI